MKGLSALAVTLLSTLSQAVCAQAGDAADRLKACSQFDGMERLKCVDELLQEVAPDSTQPQGPNWIISETTSPVDYRPQITALTTARAWSQDAPSSLAIHCRPAHRADDFHDGLLETSYGWCGEGRIPDQPRAARRTALETRGDGEKLRLSGRRRSLPAHDAG